MAARKKRTALSKAVEARDAGEKKEEAVSAEETMVPSAVQAAEPTAEFAFEEEDEDTPPPPQDPDDPKRDLAPGETTVQILPPKPPAPPLPADLRKLAPRVRVRPADLAPMRTAHQQVMARPLDRGNLEALVPHQHFTVLEDRKVMIRGRVTKMHKGQRVSTQTHDIAHLLRAGVPLRELD